MAATGDHGHDSKISSADYNEHVRNWNGFVSFVKYSIISIAAIMIFLAIFRTHG